MNDKDHQRSPLKEALLHITELRRKLAALQAAQTEPVAIIGMACRLPGGAVDPPSFWRLLEEGMDGTRDLPPDRWNAQELCDPEPGAAGKMVSARGGFLDGIDQFDPYFFGISPREAEDLDPQQRLLLEVSWEAFEDAGLAAERVAGTQTGVYVGLLTGDYGLRQMSKPERLTAYSATGMAHSTAVGRISYFFDLHGPCLALDAACASSMLAIHQAMAALRSGECDMALAGGVNAILHPLNSILMSRLQALAPDGKCKAFDARANGYVRGEGCGMLLLKTLSRAQADGDPVRAIIRGSAVNQDGLSNGLTAPNGLAQVACLRAALAQAQIAPENVGFIETHGTGTALGDPIEVEALREVYGRMRSNGLPLALGAVKTNIGHLEPAAAVAGVIKTVLALEAGVIPPNRHFRSLNPHIDLDGTPIVVPVRRQPWPALGGSRYAAVSAIGVNGCNGHLILERESETTVRREPERQPLDAPLLLPLSARRKESLTLSARAFRDLLLGVDETVAADVCYSAALHRTHHESRLTIVGRTPGELAEGLDEYLGGRLATGCYESHAAEPAPTIVYVLSGQGPRFWPLASELVAGNGIFAETLRECDQLLRRLGHPSIMDRLVGSNGKAFELTRDIQPALFSVQVALARLWEQRGIVPGAVVGHSLGEVAAAYLSGALNLEHAIEVVHHRARLIQSMSGKGAMAFVGMSGEELEQELARADSDVSVAAINGPESSVLSGDPSALVHITERLASRDVFCRVLESVDFASHCRQMDAIRVELTASLAHIKPIVPRLPFFSTTYDRQLRGAETGAEYWGDNIRNPVRFYSSIRRALDDFPCVFLEISPHPVLSATVQVIADEYDGVRGARAFPSLRRGEEPSRTFKASLGGLHAAGVAIDWRREAPRGARFMRLPFYAWKRQRYWLSEEESIGGRPSASAAGKGEPSVLAGDPVGSTAARRVALIESDEASCREQVEEIVIASVASLLRMPEARIDARRPLNQLGMDSLMAVELKADLARGLGVDVPIARVMAGASAHQVAEYVSARFAAYRDEGASTPPPVPEALGNGDSERPSLPYLAGLPRSPLEGLIIDALSDLPGCSRLRVDDDVVARCGGADRARSGLDRVSQLTAVPLADGVLDAHRTVEALARRVQAEAARRDAEQATPGGNPWLLRLGRDDVGGAARLFCFPFLGGGGSVFAGLLRNLDLGGVEAFAVQLPGRESRLLENPLFSFASVVEALTEAIAPFLDRPYVLLGHSMGALVAFELTRALRRRSLRPPEHLIASAMVPPATVPIDPFIQSLDEGRLAELAARAGNGGRHDEIMALTLPTLRADAHVLKDYSYRSDRPLECELTVLGGRDDTIAPAKELAGWRREAPGCSSLILFPGDHFYLFEQPDGAMATLRRVIAEAVPAGDRKGTDSPSRTLITPDGGCLA